VPTDIGVAGTAQGKWFESVLQVGAQSAVWGSSVEAKSHRTVGFLLRNKGAGT